MSIVRFNPPRRRVGGRPPKSRVDVVTGAFAILAVAALSILGWVAVEQHLPNEPNASQVARVPAASQATGLRWASFTMCGRDRHTCIVDGDTIWLDGQNLRLQSYDTPEPYNGICGGQTEVALAHRASARLLQLLNTNAFVVHTAGEDRYGRTLATIKIDGRDVGDILIEEGLARPWPDGYEFWCAR